jgi:hypothetical protein
MFKQIVPPKKLAGLEVVSRPNNFICSSNSIDFSPLQFLEETAHTTDVGSSRLQLNRIIQTGNAFLRDAAGKGTKDYVRKCLV